MKVGKSEFRIQKSLKEAEGKEDKESREDIVYLAACICIL